MYHTVYMYSCLVLVFNIYTYTVYIKRKIFVLVWLSLFIVVVSISLFSSYFQFKKF